MKPSSLGKSTAEARAVYDKVIEVFFFFAPIEGFDELVYPDFLGYGTAAHEFFKDREAVKQMAKLQAEQLKETKFTLTRKPVDEKFLSDGSVYLILEDFKLHMEDNDHVVPLRLSTILEKISGKWMVTHFHGSTPDANIDKEEALPMEGLRKKNEELEAKIRERTRELEIEASLERVRARSMGMQSSEELSDVLSVLFKQFDLLGIAPITAWLTLWNPEEHTFTYRSTGTSGKRIQGQQVLDINGMDIWKDLYEKWKTGTSDAVEVLFYRKEDLGQLFQLMDETFSSMPEKERLTAEHFPEGGYSVQGHCKFGYIGYTHTRKPTEEESEILTRFAREFSRVYQRFLDIEKAEAQARESQIQLSLERIRARTMAMQTTDELTDVLSLLFKQFDILGIDPAFAHLTLFNEADDTFSFRITGTSGQRVIAEQIIDMASYPAWYESYEKWKKGDPGIVDCIDYPPEVIPAVFEIMDPIFSKLPPDSEIKAKDFPHGIYTTQGHCQFGYIGFNHSRRATEEEKEIVRKFALEFGRLYQRFLDLKQAENQAREAQIEAALERVRAKAMAMHNTEDIGLTVTTFFNELLGLHPDSSLRCGIGILSQAEHMELWTASVKQSSETVLHSGTLDMSLHPLLSGVKKAWVNNDKSFSYVLKGQDRKTYFGILNKAPDYRVKFDLNALPETVYHNSFAFRDGMLFAFTEAPLQDDIRSVLERFSSVFGQTYTRYLDLLRAEAQAREAQIEAALERVRARSMAMHSTDEMQQVANAVYDQLAELGIEMDAVGMSGVIEAKQDYDVWVGGAPMGKALRIPYNEDSEVQRDYNKAIKDRTELFARTYTGIIKEEYIRNLLTHGSFPRTLETKMKTSEAFTTSIAFAKNSSIQIVRYTKEPYLQEDNEVLKRFAQVFEQAYIRFRDLQKAEAQAREAQIEAALEKVRSQSLAMHNSEEIAQVAATMFLQLTKIGINDLRRCVIYTFNQAQTKLQCWYTTEDGKSYAHHFSMPLKGSKVMQKIIRCWKSGKPLSMEVSGSLYDEWGAFIRKHGWKYPKGEKPANFMILNEFPFKYGLIEVATYSELKEEDNMISARFTQVFEQVYTRFLDLQKAETQAREAQIEAALERIRSQVTGMQESSELLDIVVTMRTEFIRLGHEAHYFWHMRWLPDTYQKAMTSGDGTRIGMVMKLPRHIHGDVPLLAKWEKSKEPTVVYAMDADAAVDYVDKMVSLGDFQQVDPQAPSADDIRKIGGLTFVMARTTHGEIGYSLPGVVPNPSAEDMNTLVRFAGVFDLAYRRFEDLKESERQKREAEIELALERVRARTMAMQHSDELAEASHLLDKEVRALGIETWGCAFNIYRETDSIEWFGNEAGLLPTYTVPRKGIFKQYYEMGQAGESLFVKEIAGEECVAHYEYMSTLPIVGDVLKQLKESNGAFPTYQIDHVVYFKYGYLLFITRKAVPEAHDIFKRFASVFEQTYTRFLDLQKAEAQAKEAVKQASIDRIRGQIASMRTAHDLERITPLIWNELTVLGVPFIRCGVFIVEESDKTVQAFLSAPDGKSLGAMRIPFDADKDTAATVAHWKKGEVYRTHWDKKQFLDFMQTMMHLGQVSNKKEYQGAEEPPESLFLHFLPFKQGMLYVGNTKSLDEDQMEAVASLADAFSIAYARYEDFVKLEMAKERIERTLGDLRETQKQLVHSEKMASLGELTAGIAHEIQNPLNFVNNFSEVSKELIVEMLEEIQKGDVEEAKALAEDIVLNLEKIHHHGQRADGIVKGMLQHSRGSSGEKESTDINVLADEYLRLAYHGLRAKDKSFNATLETQFDDSLSKVHVVPQDIGRVILNLITNAFHVVKEKKEKAGEGYRPTVTVTTRKNANGVEISVKDNGNGIPEDIRDKIFQPFFTTKPTGEGTGLGLSMSYDIVTKGHGGELRLHSNVGEGTTFTVWLPEK